LKEVLREALRLNLDEGGAMLDEWLAWASRSRLAPLRAVSISDGLSVTVVDGTGRS
jgi:hypothetical protein